MIYDLTEDNLRKLGLTEADIEDINNCNDTVADFYGFGSGAINLYVNYSESKFYTGEDFYFRSDRIDFPRQYPDLFPRYFILKWEKYLKKYKGDSGGLSISEQLLKDRFKEQEIEKANETIRTKKSERTILRSQFTEDFITECQVYLDWLMSENDCFGQSNHSKDNEIAMKLIGLVGNHNTGNTTQPVYYYIPEVLTEYNISPKNGAEIVLKMAGTVSPEWNKNVVPYIVKNLREMEQVAAPQPVASGKADEIHKKYDKTTTENFKTKLWFKVGLMIANGEMEVLKKKHSDNYSSIAKELDNVNYRPYISDSYGTNSESDKNIFNSARKMRIIYDYCITENIEITPFFLSKYESIQDQ